MFPARLLPLPYSSPRVPDVGSNGGLGVLTWTGFLAFLCPGNIMVPLGGHKGTLGRQHEISASVPMLGYLRKLGTQLGPSGSWQVGRVEKDPVSCLTLDPGATGL